MSNEFWGEYVMAYKNLKYKPGYVYVSLVKYKGKKFVIQLKQISGNVKGIRLDVYNVKTIGIDINLSAGEKQLALHKLITGRNVKRELHKYKGSIYVV